jgi:hypothetical protein
VVQTKADEGRLRDERVWRINLFVGVKLSKVPNMTPVSCQICTAWTWHICFFSYEKKQTQRQRPSSCTTKHDDRLSSSVECLRCRDVDPFPRFFWKINDQKSRSRNGYCQVFLISISWSWKTYYPKRPYFENRTYLKEAVTKSKSQAGGLGLRAWGLRAKIRAHSRIL